MPLPSASGLRVARYLIVWRRTVATSPNRVRTALTVVTAAAVAEARQVVAAAETPAATRTALFAAVPLIIPEYAAGSSALALDWFEELREDADTRRRFTPQPIELVTEDNFAAMIARATESLYEVEIGVREDIEKALAESLAEIEAQIVREVADAYRDTIIENAANDPESVGWRRFARPEACKFCLMLAARGAVYKATTARFAAHGADMGNGRKGGDCMCIAGPAYGGKETWAEATPMQYLASKEKRTAKERKALREYLNTNFPDAPG